MNIIFMGTPDFAVPMLKALIGSHNVCAVFTQSDKKKGRGQHMLAPPIKQLALENEIEVFQPKTLRDENVINVIKNLAPDLIVVVAYGKMLPKDVLEIPKYGCVNVHASILPKYRGAGPIQWSVLNGESQTGVTTMFMGEGMDTGDILLVSKTAIGENETASELHDRLSQMGAPLLLDTITAIENGSLKSTPQVLEDVTFAPKLSKDMSPIDFSLPAKKVHNHICGLSEWPCATIEYGDKKLKVYKSKVVQKPFSPKAFVIECSDKTYIELCEVQIEGSKRMSGEEFLRGHSNPRPIE